MKSFIAALPIFSAAVFAAPSTRRSLYDVKITLTNDHTGANVQHGVPSGNYPNSISAIWGQDENLKVDGAIKASSAMLNDATINGKRVDCVFQINGYEYTLNSEASWVDLDGIAGASLVDLTNQKVSCIVEGEPISKKRASKMNRRSEFDINVTLFDDKTGASVTKGVPSGGFENSISAIFGGSNLDKDGAILATSAQLATLSVGNERGIKCQFIFPGTTLEVNSLATWLDFDGVPGAEVVDITEGKIACIVDGEQLVDN